MSYIPFNLGCVAPKRQVLFPSVEHFPTALCSVRMREGVDSVLQPINAREHSLSSCYYLQKCMCARTYAWQGAGLLIMSGAKLNPYSQGFGKGSGALELPVVSCTGSCIQRVWLVIFKFTIYIAGSISLSCCVDTCHFLHVSNTIISGKVFKYIGFQPLGKHAAPCLASMWYLISTGTILDYFGYFEECFKDILNAS